MKIILIGKSGCLPKKKLKKKYCVECGKELTKSTQTKFCSHSCSSSFNNRKRLKVTHIKKDTRKRKRINYISNNKFCLMCGKNLFTHQDKFCSSECNIKHKLEEYIKKWKSGDVTGLSGEYGISGYIKRYMFKKHNNSCQICGWNEVNPYTNKIPLEIHHVDGNYLNNNEENLQLLCPNCHALTSTYKAANKNGRKGRDKYI